MHLEYLYVTRLSVRHVRISNFKKRVMRMAKTDMNIYQVMSNSEMTHLWRRCL